MWKLGKVCMVAENEKMVVPEQRSSIRRTIMMMMVMTMMIIHTCWRNMTGDWVKI